MIGALTDSRINDNNSVNACWRFPPADLELKRDVVDVWLLRLDTENIAVFGNVISADEQARAERFRFEPDRKRFIAARSFLRIILGKYLHINPRQICFQYNKYGKPSVGGKHNEKIKFNLSHSGNLALFAVTEAREIGVDIERIKTSFVEETMALDCLTEQEIKHFQRLSGTDRDLFFFTCWTRKEAYLKACGKGLSLAANKIETLSLSEFSTDYFGNNTESRQIRWSIMQIPSISGYAAALAVEGGGRQQLRFWQQSNAELP